MFRKDLIDLLLENPMGVTQIARAVKESPSQIADDLQHLLRSLKHSDYRAAIEAARCRACGFEFARKNYKAFQMPGMSQHLGPGTKDRDPATIVNRTNHMIPIHELLNRIRWDPAFAKGEFQLGYYDRAEVESSWCRSRKVTFPPESPQTFQLIGLEGQEHRIPFHRVREVYKDSQRIWHRPRET